MGRRLNACAGRLAALRYDRARGGCEAAAARTEFADPQSSHLLESNATGSVTQPASLVCTTTNRRKRTRARRCRHSFYLSVVLVVIPNNTGLRDKLKEKNN